MQKSFTRRVLLAVVIALVITTALSIAVSAASVTYNYATKYSSAAEGKYDPENAAAGGFTTNSGTLLYAEGAYALQDTTATAKGYVDESIRFTYHIPEAEQVNIKDYGAIKFDRRMSNGDNLIKSYNARFGVTLVMDDGQTIERDYLWARVINDVDMTGAGHREYVDVDIAKEIEALEGNPKLVSIVYSPYVGSDYFHIPENQLPVADDPATEDVNEKKAGSAYYFMVKYFTLEEAAKAPENLGAVTDTWDGETVTEHNGKITGLDAAKSYKYAPVHSYEADYVAVSGATEITGLVGGVYEVIATEEGKADSPKVIVIVPKTTQPAFTNLDTPNGKYSYSFEPKSGYWTSLFAKQSPSGKYVHSYFLPQALWTSTKLYNGFTVADTAAAQEYYAHNVQAHTYTLAPEEQFSVDAKFMDLSLYLQNVSLGYPWEASTFGFTVYIYVNGETEPAAAKKGLWTNSAAEMWASEINLSNDYDGYVTGFKFAFITDYPETDGIAGQRYLMSRGMRTKDLTPNTFVPTVEKMNATTFKIGGLDASKVYRFSTDGKTFTEVKDSTFVSFEGAKAYIQELGTALGAASEVYEVSAAAFQPDVAGVTLNGNVLSGFDANTAYEYAPVNVNEKVWTDVEGTSLELTAGAWAVRVKASETLGASAPTYFFVKGENSGKLSWVGTVSGENGPKFVQGKWNEAIANTAYFQFSANESNFASNFLVDISRHAEMAWQYALNNDEVFPIENFNTMTFKYGWASGVQFGGMDTATSTVRFFVEGAPVAYYDVLVDYKQIQSGGVGNSITVDASMLPADAEGYVTAMKFYPWTEIRDANGSSDLANFTNKGNKYPVFQITSNEAAGASDSFKYRINLWGEASPKGIELVKLDTPTDYFRGYKITGLDANKAYEVSINGKDYTAVAAGTTELTDLISAEYAIRYAATETTQASAAVKFYVPLINPAFSRVENSAYGVSTAGGFVDGRWTLTGLSGISISATGERFPHTYIGQHIVLSSVEMKYKFAEEEKFTVDEYPYLSFDFNDELNNAFAGGNVPGAVLALDVYIEGVDTPYTFTQDWGDNTITHALVNSMFTNNRVIVNLLDEHAELAGKTVEAIRIRPFSNIDDTLDNLVDEADKAKDNYTYFRLYHLGFFETAANVRNATPNFTPTSTTFDSIRAESNTMYAVGATPVISEFSVYEVFSDGTEFEVKNATVTAPELTEAGKYNATITWRGKTTTAEIAVGLDSIKIEQNPTKVEYFEGEAVDLAGIVIKAVLGDGSEVDVTDNYTANVETVELGMTEITVTYGGKTATFPITVNAIEVIAIEIVTYPDMELEGGWEAGATPDFTGLVVKATYNNGDEVEVALADLEVSYGADVMTPDTALAITYDGFTFEGYVPSVVVPAVTEIAIATPAEKLTYLAGEELDTTGLTLTATYNNGKTATVTEGFTAEADFENGIVTVTYEDATVTYEITVRAIDVMFISQPAEKLEYVVGEELDTTGLLVYVIYSDGEEEEISEGFEVICDDFTAAGTYTVTVKMGELSEDYVVTVTAPEEPEEPEEPENVASGTIDGTDIEWVIDEDGVLTISGTDAIPDYTSSARAPWASYAANVTSIVIEEGITEIGNYGIAYLTNATSVTVPASVTYVGQLFMRNTKIAEIELPGVELVENAAFNGAASLTKVIFSESLCDVRGEAFATTQVVTVEAPAASYAFNYADYYATMYAGKATLTAVSDGTTAAQPILAFGKIGDNAFFAIYEIAANTNQMVISGAGTTYNYWYISEKRIQMDKEQGGNNFAPLYYMYEDEETQPIVRNILTLTVREGITSIGNYSFYRCLKARNVEILGNVTWIGNAAFQACEAIRSLTLPESCTRFGDYVFNGCKYLGSITVLGEMTQIGPEIFKNCLTERDGEARPESANLLVYTNSQFLKDYIAEVYPNENYRVVVRAPK